MPDRPAAETPERRRAHRATPPLPALPRSSLTTLGSRLDRVATPLPGSDPDDLVHRADPDLAITDLPGGGGLHDHVQHLGRVSVLDDDLDLRLGDEVDRVLGTAVDLGVPL